MIFKLAVLSTIVFSGIKSGALGKPAVGIPSKTQGTQDPHRLELLSIPVDGLRNLFDPSRIENSDVAVTPVQTTVPQSNITLDGESLSSVHAIWIMRVETSSSSITYVLQKQVFSLNQLLRLCLRLWLRPS